MDRRITVKSALKPRQNKQTKRLRDIYYITDVQKEERLAAAQQLLYVPF